MLAEVSASPSLTMPVSCGRSSACRRLFQDEPIDRAERRRFTQALDEALSHRDAEAWGFDFKNGTPFATAGGRWEWTEVDSADVPVSYRPKLAVHVSVARALDPKATGVAEESPPQGLVAEAPSAVDMGSGSSSEDELRLGLGLDSIDRGCCTPSSAEGSDASQAAASSSSSLQQDCQPEPSSSSSQTRGVKRKQTAMTDYFRTKKRKIEAISKQQNH